MSFCLSFWSFIPNRFSLEFFSDILLKSLFNLISIEGDKFEWNFSLRDVNTNEIKTVTTAQSEIHSFVEMDLFILAKIIVKNNEIYWSLFQVWEDLKF